MHLRHALRLKHEEDKDDDEIKNKGVFGNFYDWKDQRNPDDILKYDRVGTTTVRKSITNNLEAKLIMGFTLIVVMFVLHRYYRWYVKNRKVT